MMRSGQSGGPIAIAVAVAVAAALLAGAVQLQAARERIYPSRGADDESLYLRSGRAVRRLAGPMTTLAADLYWIRAIQHYGGTKVRLMQQARLPEPPPGLAAPSNEYSLLHPLLDIATTLDPRFKIAYRFGAVFLAESYPNGPGRPDLAIALLEKGLRAQPDKWEYMEDIGFVHYWYRHDYPAASDWFRRASEVPGAPWWLRSLAATTLTQGGDRRSSRLMWEAIRQSAEIDWLRNDADRRLAQLNALDAIDELQRRVDLFSKNAGAPPADWQALIAAGLLSAEPRDPVLTPYELTPEGKVRLSSHSSLWPLPDEAPPLVPRPS
jgi:hypothetical protein